MSYATTNRLSGLVILVTGVSTILFNAALWTGVIPRTWEYPGYLTLQIMFLFSLVSLLFRHGDRLGKLLLAGFVLVIVDLVFGLGFSYYASFVFPILRVGFPDAVREVLGGPVGTISMVSLVVGIMGNITFYTGILRARIVPRWAPIVTIAGQVLGLAMLPYNIPVIVSCVGLIGIGAFLVANRSQVSGIQVSSPSTAA